MGNTMPSEGREEAARGDRWEASEVELSWWLSKALNVGDTGR